MSASRDTAVAPGRAETTRRRVLDAAAAVFLRDGYAATRLTDVAEAAGLQTGSLYYHFDSREDLVAEVLRIGQLHMVSALDAALASLPPEASAPDVVAAATRGHVSAILSGGDHCAASLRIIGQVPAHVRAERACSQEEYGARWRSLLHDIVRPDVDERAARLLLLGMLNSVLEWSGRANGASRLGESLGAIAGSGIGLSRGGRRPRERSLRTSDPGAPPRVSDAKRRILDGAAQAVGSVGVSARLSDIAAVAGVGAGTIYHHFDSRDALLVELLHEAGHQVETALRRDLGRLPADAPHRERLQCAVASHLASVHAPGSYAPSLIRSLMHVSSDVRASTLDLRRRYSATWSNLFADAANDGAIEPTLDPLLLQHLTLGSLNWSIEWFTPERGLATDGLAAQFTTLLLEGLIDPRTM